MNTITITNLNKNYPYPTGTALKDILKDVQGELPYPVYLAKLDNAYRALTHETSHDSTVEFLDLRNQEAWLVYQNSLILIFMLSIFLGYFSGCLYPVSFFPETLQKLTVFQPVGASVLFFGHSLLLQNHLPSLCSVLVWILGLFMLCVLIRERRIRR